MRSCKLAMTRFTLSACGPSASSVHAGPIRTTWARAWSGRRTAQLFENCLPSRAVHRHSRRAKYEGAEALQTGFRVLGQVAVRELFADPGVASGLGDLGKHIDKQKIEQALGAAK